MNMNMLSNRTGGIPALIFAVLLIISGFSPRNVSAQDYYDNGYNDDYGDYQEFYDDLAPHGQWLNDPQYGYVWTPNAGRDFRPYYSNGHWAMTEYGNMWVSDYSWGWAPFHYGRWAQSSYYGWIWIPGRVWGPSWVTWRQGGGYYGWAPMGPGISINFSFGSGYNSPNDWWTFVPCGNIYSRSYNRYYQPRRTVNIINNTTIINNTYVDARSRNTFVSGPRRNEVETATRQRVTVYNVNNRTRAGSSEISGRNVNVYRPAIRSVNTRSAEIAAPRQVKSVERSVITNAGGGRAPSRLPAAVESSRSQNQREISQPGNNSRNNAVQQQRSTREVQQNNQQPVLQQSNQRGIQAEQRAVREQQIQQQRNQRDVQADQRARDQQIQQNRQAQQQQQMMRDQQIQQNRQAQQQQQMMREQQQQQSRQAEQQQRMIRDQQVQQQRAQEQQQRMMRDQQEQQRRAQDQQRQQQQIQRDQQMQQQRSMERQQQQQQRSVERAQPQRVERSAPAPRERSVERSAR